MVDITNNFRKVNNLCEDTIEEIEVKTYSKENGIYYSKKRFLSEHVIDVSINERPAFSLVCTATDLPYLIVGRLISEKIVSDISEIEKIYICSEGISAKVYIDKNVELEDSINIVRSCCSDNVQKIAGKNRKPSQVSGTINTNSENFKDTISAAIDIFDKDTKLHKMTSGTHTCYLINGNNLIYTGEDIGRHNALDKAIGYIYVNDISLNDIILFTTGRIPTDMVRKVVNAGIPVFVSKSVPTKEAIFMAKEYGITLIGRAWPDSFEMYN